MSITFNNTGFDGSQASTGAIAAGTYTGTTLTGAIGTTAVSITGTIDQPGSSTVLVDINAAGLNAVGAQGTYVGYSALDNSHYEYYFAVSGGGLVTPVTVAVSGEALPATQALVTVDASAVTAPVDPALPCFCDGTLIRTSRGDIAVEQLRAGDKAVTPSGAERPIRWIGHRSVDCRRHPRPEEAMPVRIRAGALGEGRPARDLLVSPGHGIALDLLGEVIVTAGSLVNGSTIVQEDVERVTYWHVELDSHDLLLAEGQPAESYLDMGNRAFFAQHTGEGTVVDVRAAPDADRAGRSHADFCRPFHGEGPLLAFARERLNARAAALGWHLSCDRPWSDVHLVADGVRCEPEVRGPVARFRAPAGAEDVWLVSPTASPCDLGINGDARRLGLNLAELRVGQGWDARTVALDDPLLCVGFHAFEREDGTPRRWTAGCARLPTDLWTGDDRTLVVRLDEGRPVLPRWVGPEAASTAAGGPAGLRLVRAA